MAADDKKLSVGSLTKAQRRELQKLSRPDEIHATVGVLNMMTTVAIAVRFPAYYWIWHICRTSFYLPSRFVRFKEKGWELYLLDWCYVVTYLSTICSFLAFLRVTFGITAIPMLEAYNADLILAGFAMASGPLAWSVMIFRNSVVFHDVDHSTSVFVHLSPVVLFWCLRWGAGVPSVIEDQWPTMFHVCESPEDWQAANACFETFSKMMWCSACSTSLFSFVVPPALLYVFVWSIPYYLSMFVIGKDWVKRTGRQTLYTYFLQSQPDVHDFCAKKMQPLVGAQHAGPMGYMVLHFCSNIVFCSTSYLLWHSFLLHTLLMILVLAKAVDNGSSFMFRVFAYRYADDCLKKHQDKILKKGE